MTGMCERRTAALELGGGRRPVTTAGRLPVTTAGWPCIRSNQKLRVFDNRDLAALNAEKLHSVRGQAHVGGSCDRRATEGD